MLKALEMLVGTDQRMDFANQVIYFYIAGIVALFLWVYR